MMQKQLHIMVVTNLILSKRGGDEQQCKQTEIKIAILVSIFRYVNNNDAER